MKLALFRPLIALALVVATFVTSTASADGLGHRSVAALTPTLQAPTLSPITATWAPALHAAPSRLVGSQLLAPSLHQPSLFPQGMSGSPFLATPDADEPSSGLGFIISGWILTGLGAINLATLPLCFTSFYVDAGVKGVCLGVSAAFIGVGLGVGVPFLIVGYNQRKKHQAWEKDHPTLGHLARTRLTALPGGAAALYTATF